MIRLLVAASCWLMPHAADVNAYILTDRATLRDTLVTVTVCISSRARTAPIGNYRGELIFDEYTRIVRVNPSTPGHHAEHPQADRVLFAGADAKGFTSAPVLSVVVRVDPGVTPMLTLRITELSSSDGRNLLPALAFVNNPRKMTDLCATSRERKPPLITGLAQDSVSYQSIEAGTPLSVEVHGCHFDATANTVRFGPLTLRNLPSRDHGTVLLFIVSPMTLANSEVAPQQLRQGRYDVSVSTRYGISNTASFVIH